MPSRRAVTRATWSTGVAARPVTRSMLLAMGCRLDREPKLHCHDHRYSQPFGYARFPPCFTSFTIAFASHRINMIISQQTKSLHSAPRPPPP